MAGPCTAGGRASAWGLDTPLAEVIHARLPGAVHEQRPWTAGLGFNARYSANGGGTGCAGSRLISSFNSLLGVK